MKQIKIYCLISFLLFISCIGHKVDNRFIITQNNSEEKIYSFFLENELCNVNIFTNFYFPKDSLLPNEKSFDHVDKLTWEEYIKTCDDQKIRYYIVKKDSVDKYGWKEVFSKNIYNKKYLFTIEDLDKMNWTITYDGN
jgi:hypothetical protein